MLSAEITSLAVSLRKTINARKRSKTLATVTRARVKRRDWSLKYHDDHGFANFQSERTDQEFWDPDDQQDFQKSFTQDSVAFNDLARKFGTNAFLLDRFVRSFCFAAFDGVSKKEIEARVHSLCLQLAEKPLRVKVTAFLDGISIAGPQLKLSRALVLRKPVQADLTQEGLVDKYGGFELPLNETWFSLIGEFTTDAISIGEAQNEFVRTVEALRLFRVGGVSTGRYQMDSRHFMSGGVLSGGYRRSRFSYGVSESDAEVLPQFLKAICPVLPNPFQMDQVNTDVGIAHIRYLDALFQTGGPERVITSAITALEALFLENTPELAHRLAERSAIFLKLLGAELDTPKTYNNVKQGYDFRSTFVHGNPLKANDIPRAVALMPEIMEYARRCVLARLQMQTEIKKKDFMVTLDRAILDPGIASQFKQDLKRLVRH